MSDIALLYATFPDRVVAERIVERVIDERLAACANLLGGSTAIYRWQGAVERSEEVPVLFKTTPLLAEALRSRIEALHPYDVAVVETWPAAVGTAAGAWVAAETG